MQLLRGKRMKLPSTGFVAVQNNSRYFSEKQGRGSLAMLFDARKDRDFIAIDSNRDEQKTPSNSLKWRLIVCHSVLEEGTKFYYFKSNIEVDFRNQQFIPRNVFSDYLLEFVNLGGPKTTTTTTTPTTKDEQVDDDEMLSSSFREGEWT